MFYYKVTILKYIKTKMTVVYSLRFVSDITQESIYSNNIYIIKIQKYI